MTQLTQLINKSEKLEQEISLEEALQPDIVRSYATQSTGKKYLITPHKE